MTATAGKLSVLCDNPLPQRGLLKLLNEQSASWNQAVTLILDSPVGYAWREHLRDHVPCSAIICANTCTAYLANLWALSPRALIVTPSCLDEIAQHLTRVSEGERFYHGPSLDHPLSSAELEVLHLLATEALSDKEIATRLNRSSKTVGHQVGSILRKLGVDRRARLVHYYFGLSL